MPESSNKEASSLLCGIPCFLPEICAISLSPTCIPRCGKQLRYNIQINPLLQHCSPCIHHVFLVILKHNFSYDALETSPLLHKPTITFVKFLIMSWNYHLCPFPVLMLHHQVFSDLCKINWWLASCDSCWSEKFLCSMTITEAQPRLSRALASKQDIRELHWQKLCPNHGLALFCEVVHISVQLMREILCFWGKLSEDRKAGVMEDQCDRRTGKGALSWWEMTLPYFC